MDFDTPDAHWLVPVLTAVGLLCGAIGALIAKIAPIWSAARTKAAEDDRKGQALLWQLKREAIHETRTEHQTLLNRKEADIIIRDKMLAESGKKIEELYTIQHKLMTEHAAQIHILMAEKTAGLIANERLSAQIALLKARLERVEAEGLSKISGEDQAIWKLDEGRGAAAKAIVSMPGEGGSTLVSVPEGATISVDDNKGMVVDVTTEGEAEKKGVG